MEAIELLTNGFETLLRVRKDHPQRFIDVEYEDLVANPLEQFRWLLNEMGFEVGLEDERAASEWIAKNRRNTHPSHHYRLEDYGLTADRVTAALRPYAHREPHGER